MGLWQTHARTIDPARFRSPDQYLSEPVGYPYGDLVRWARREHPFWLDSLTEDGAFGCATAVAAEGKTVSRDLLDSICELSFLERAVPELATMRVLDIGAGYGRFAHRFGAAYPHSFTWCTDAHDVSLDVCERYLVHRGVHNAAIIGSGALEHIPEPIDLAVNIHSWSECSLGEVSWWIGRLSGLGVTRLFIVPHTPDFETWVDGAGAVGESYLPALQACGWRLSAKWGGPECWPRTYALFRRD